MTQNRKVRLGGWLPNNRTRARRPLSSRSWKPRPKAGRVVVEAVRSAEQFCPYYREAQKVIVYPLDKESSDDICMPMFCTFAPFWRALAHGVRPIELGMTMENADPDVGYFTCHVCPVDSTLEHQSSASVVFKVYTYPSSGEARQQGPNAQKLAELRNLGLWYPPYWPLDE